MPLVEENAGGGDTKAAQAILNAYAIAAAAARDTPSAKWARPGTAKKRVSPKSTTANKHVVQPTRAGTTVAAPRRTAALAQRRKVSDDWLHVFGSTKFGSSNYPFARWTYEGGHLAVKTAKANPNSGIRKDVGKLESEVKSGLGWLWSEGKKTGPVVSKGATRVSRVSGEVALGADVAGLSTLDVPGLGEALLATGELAGYVSVGASGVAAVTHPTKQTEKQFIEQFAAAAAGEVGADVAGKGGRLTKREKSALGAVLEVFEKLAATDRMSGVGK